MSASAVRPTPGWMIGLLFAGLVLLIGLRLWFHLAVSPMGDEAYYWMWGQHIAWSYFDHPPLQAWLLSLVAAIFGWTNFSVRLLTWLTLGGTLAIFWLWAGRLAAADRLGWFLATSLLYLTIPAITVMTGIAFQDHLLLFFVAAASYAFYVFATLYEAGAPRWRWLYLAAALLGFALLSKYNGVFLALGFGLAILLRRPLRPLLLVPHLWLALLLAVVMQAPVIAWNLTEGLASFRFHLLDRPNVSLGHIKIDQMLTFLEVAAISMSPVLALGVLRSPWILRRLGQDERRAGVLAMLVFVSSLLAWAGISLVVLVYFHWNIVAYAALAPIGLRLVGGRIGLAIHVLLGLAIAVALTLNYTLLPQGLFGIRDPGAPANYGWPAVAAEIATLQHDHPEAFLAATRYTYAAQLGFQLHRTDVMAFNPVRSENDYWWNAAAHAGEDALIVADRQFRIGYAKAAFASLEKLATVTTTDPSGASAWSFDIWLGKSYSPPPPPAEATP